jgi:alkylation response protein AidB-like acyl-CoA dehydrogenase
MKTSNSIPAPALDSASFDIEDLRLFAESIVADAQQRFPDLMDMAHGERNSLDENDRLVPALLGLRAEIRQRSASRGYYGGFMPPEAGGAGWSHATSLQVSETLARFPAYPQALWPNLGTFVAGQGWGPSQSLLSGDAILRERYLAPLMNGAATSCVGITDPEAGSDPQNMQAFARRTESGSYVINGVKHIIGNAPYADVILFYARTSGEIGNYRGISLFVLEPGDEGLAIDHVYPVMEGRGNHGRIVADNCEVPTWRLVGEEGSGFRYMMKFVDSGRLGVGAVALGGAEWCLDQAVERLRNRHTFGAPLSDRQGLRWRIAELQSQIVSLRATIHEAAHRLDNGQDARVETATAKLLGPRVYSAAADLALQVWGGDGFLAGRAIERHYRRARGMRIYVGTDEMQLNTIAKATIG